MQVTRSKHRTFLLRPRFPLAPGCSLWYVQIASMSAMAKKRLNILLQDELLIGSPETHSLCWLPPVPLGKAEADESGSQHRSETGPRSAIRHFL